MRAYDVLSDGGPWSPGEAPNVVCVVLNWNGWRDTLGCLQALRQSDYAPLRVVVVDNCSTDDSVERIREWIAERFSEVALLVAERNRGFGAGNNLGIRWGMAEGARYIWLLNNDTVAAPDALGLMVARAEGDEGLGAVGSVLHYRDRPEEVQAWGGGRADRWTGFARHAVTPQPDGWFDYLTAASMLVRAKAFEEVGMFDEAFFLYWEDTDLGFRIRGGGWRLAVSVGATVLHAEGASLGRNYGRLDRFSTCSGLRFLSKHAPVPMVSAGVYLVMRLGKRALRGEWLRVRAVLEGVGDFRRERGR